MKRVERSADLIWKNNPSAYQRINRSIFYPTILNLTATTNAVKGIIANSDELASIMPNIVGKSFKDEGWQRTIAEWFSSISIGVPSGGLTLNLSYTFNYHRDNITFKNHLEEYLNRKNVDINALMEIEDVSKREQVITDYISGVSGNEYKCEEQELYKLVEFEDATHYIYYRFALLSSLVANNIEDINKSPRIKFVITSNEDIAAEQKAIYTLNQDALTKYMDISTKDNTTIDNILVSFGLVSSIDELKNMNQSQKLMAIQQLAMTDAAKFIKLYKRPNHVLRATIEKYIWANIFTRSSDTGVIVDSADNAKVIGNDIDDAVTFFNNKSNIAYIEQIKSKYKVI